MRYASLRHIWLRLRAIVANFVMRCGPLRQIWLYAMGNCAEESRTVKISNDFSAVGHGAGYCYAQLAVVQCSA
jgi:hypothetical protein